MLGLLVSKTKDRGHAVHFCFRIRVSEIRPWLASQASKLSSPLVLKWQRGDRHSGTTRSVMPLPPTSFGDGKIVFNESFELLATLYCSPTNKGGSGITPFQEKLLVFSLAETNNTTPQTLARATVDLAGYAAIEEPKSISIPLVLSKNVPVGAALPNLLIVIGSYMHTGACFGQGNWHKAPIASYLPMLSTARVQSCKSSSSSGLDGQTREALEAALLDEDELEITSFTDEESPEGPGTPQHDKSLKESKEGKAEHAALSSNLSFVDSVLDARHSDSELSISEISTSGKDAYLTCLCVMGETKISSHIASCNAGTQTPRDTNVLEAPHIDPLWSIENDGSMWEEKVPSSDVDERKFLKKFQEKADATAEGRKLQQESVLETQHTYLVSNGKLAEIVRMKELVQISKPMIQSSLMGMDDRETQTMQTPWRSLGSKQLTQLGSKFWRFDDLDTEDIEEFDGDLSSEQEGFSVLEEARLKFAQGAEKRNEKIGKRALEDAKVKLAEAEAEYSAASEKISQLQFYISSLTGELQDVAAVEAIIHSATAEHGGAPEALLVPACLLFKLHNFVSTNWSTERRASFMDNLVAGFILVTRACGQDISRLAFWWSNVVALRHAMMLSQDSLQNNKLKPGDPSKVAHSDGFNVRSTSELSALHQSSSADPSGCNFEGHWEILERVEAWIYSRIVELLWGQALAPQMETQVNARLELSLPTDKLEKEGNIDSDKENLASEPFDLEEGLRQNLSIDIWKQAFLDSLRRLCPVRANGRECGCIPGLSRLVLEACVARLDVSMFNAILQSSEDDPISDQVKNLKVLPIPPGKLTFGAGMQLQNAVGTWSAWLTTLLEKHSSGMNILVSDEDRKFIKFPLLKELANLLMLPRDMVADKTVRKEVCPVLALSVIKRVFSSIQTDEFAPDPVTPSLLAAINAEVSLEKQMYGDVPSNFSLSGLALNPHLIYSSQSNIFRDLVEHAVIGAVSDWSPAFSTSGSFTDRHDELRSSILSPMQECHNVLLGAHKCIHASGQFDASQAANVPVSIHRFELLQEIFATKVADQS